VNVFDIFSQEYDTLNFDDENNLNNLFSNRVLVLNQSYQPLTICSPQRAYALIFLAKAEILETYKNKFIRTVNRKYALPSVIKLNKYVKLTFRTVEISRKNIFKRDNSKCQYCGTKFHLTIDHIIPKSRGGEDTWENLVTACIKCNNSKGNRTPKEANMKLMSVPKKPNYIVFLRTSLGKIEDNWKQYLFF
jgi:5-methylcytosine-specific restriction endonuclease McrA